jgi:putative colanic acid biosynthesis acetyltransferase WcaF
VTLPAGNRFRLAGFTGREYEPGRPLPIRVAWLSSRWLTMKWWFPNKLRVTALRAFGASIGDGVLIRHDVRIHWPWKLAVGAHSWIGESVWILNLERVTIGSNTCISQGVLLCTGSHDRRSETFEFDNAEITIGDSVWVAARATVLRGVHVGDGATVGATALVTSDVRRDSIVLGPQASEHRPSGR